MSENSDAVSMEPISPELALVDPELGARARATLEDPRPAARSVQPSAAPDRSRGASIARTRSGHASRPRSGSSSSGS